MKALTLFCVAAVAAGCSRNETALRGSLGEGWSDEPLFVSVDGVPEPVAVVSDTFALSGIPAGPVILRIRNEHGEMARIEIRDLPAGASLSLERIRRRRREDLAFPSAVRMEGGDAVTINGIRMADPDALPRRVEADGVVLAMDDEEDAMLVRPRSADVPDLPVVVTDSTRVLDAAGEDASLARLSAGDTVRVEGRTASGYVYAERIRLAGAPANVPDADEPARGTRAPERARDAGEAREADEPRSVSRRRESRGRGQVPEGHKPPPGECRDWDPNLPPGQQPPPRKC
ncbi:MAG TPA: DUF5666 domain-containing protein [Longimicrobium sp.]|nr:DUF5666 domain-containing protein [Longimicrobium sp.]